MEKEPRLLVEDTQGVHNKNLEETIKRVEKSKMHKDLSTIIICPTRGTFPTRVVQSWMKLMRPMNQPVAGPIFAESIEVGKAYNELIKYILGNEYLSKFKYILTIEEDNLPPPDGLIKLYESMDDYDVVGGLYWSKSEDGFPMMFGDINIPGDFKPVKPKMNSVQQVNGLGMGFNLFKLDMFREIEGPWFKTEQIADITKEASYTQDIYFYKKAAEKGFTFACDTNILVGHLDSKTDKVW